MCCVCQDTNYNISQFFFAPPQSKLHSNSSHNYFTMSYSRNYPHSGTLTPVFIFSKFYKKNVIIKEILVDLHYILTNMFDL